MTLCASEKYCSASVTRVLILLGIFTIAKTTNITSINNSLSLQNCHLQDLKDIHEYGTDLREIYISHCWILQLPNALFIRFTELRTLEISDSKLTIVHDFALNGLKNLKSLHFVRNNISELKSWSNSDLVSLHYLDLRRNAIKSVDANRLKRYPNLQKLNLAVNLIEDIPEGTFKILTHLKYLNFGKNLLRSIFNFTFKGLIKLSHLSLHFNEIEFIEQNAFSTNTHLRSLRLEGNKLRHLDFRITANLYRLCHLNISHNYLESLGNGIFSKTLELQDIDMSYNHIKSIGEHVFLGLQYLEMINATNNYIKEIHFNAFSSLNNLIFLDLSNNNMTYLSSDLLQNSSRLQYLNLSKNSLEDIDSDTFSGLEMLKDLDLSFNGLQTDNFLSLHPSVEYLDMRGNSFHQLNLSKLQNIDRVELAENPWSCNWLIQKMTKPASSILFGNNYIVSSREHSLSISEVDCLDGTQKRSVVIVNKMNGIEDIQQMSTNQNLVKWPEFKTAFDSFDQKSVVIWLIVAIALVFTAVRVGRGWMQRSERRSKELRRLQREKMLKDVEDYFDSPNVVCEQN